MKPLRVLHVNASCTDGGAARAAARIHRAQRRLGIDSHMLVLERREPVGHVHQPLSGARRAALRVHQILAARRLARQATPSNPVLHSLNWFSSGLAEWINAGDFDVVNLHWLGSEMLSVEEIARIRKPLCWTMHDMWPFSGAEHYDDLQNPGRYRTTYGAASRPSNYRGTDLDAWVWRRKQKAWKGKRFQLISPSQWLAGCAKESQLMGHQPCSVIPNCVDTRVFKSLDRRQARIILNLDPNKRYILFGAMSSLSDSRKGFHLLQPALKLLAEQPGIRGTTELLVFGAEEPVSPPDLALPTHYVGSLHDDLSLALLYSAADVFACPSMQDNLPNTLVESLSSGTPCVAFRLGGMTDLIQHGSMGWLAEPYESADFMAGLFKALTVPPDRQVMRNCAMRRYSEALVGKQYLDLYSSILDGHL